MPAQESTSIAFEVIACHGDHAGKAHLALRACDGAAEIAIRHMPFEADPGQTLCEEQTRILAQAAELARQAADFLEAEAGLTRTWPTAAPAPPNAFGQPLPHG